MKKPSSARRILIMSNLAILTLAAISSTPGCKKQKPVPPQKPVEEQLEQKAVEAEPEKPVAGLKKVRLQTTMGDIVIELDENAAPVTVKNFLRYVQEGSYDGTIFHRVIHNFMIQGGGFTADMLRKQSHPPIVSEAENGLKNNRATVAMARAPQDPNSATSQFFINQKDNNSLDYAGQRKPGYAVFGKVVEGMDVVDAIAGVRTTRKGRYADVPIEPVVVKSARVLLSD